MKFPPYLPLLLVIFAATIGFIDQKLERFESPKPYSESIDKVFMPPLNHNTSEEDEDLYSRARAGDTNAMLQLADKHRRLPEGTPLECNPYVNRSPAGLGQKKPKCPAHLKNKIRENIQIGYVMYKVAAERGNAVAQEKMGSIKINLFRISKRKVHLEEALYWFKKAATNGSADAIYELSLLHGSKENHPFYNAELSERLLKKALEEGSSLAKYSVCAYSGLYQHIEGLQKPSLEECNEIAIKAGYSRASPDGFIFHERDTAEPNTP